MSKMKILSVMLAAVFLLAFGAVSVYAVSSDDGGAGNSRAEQESLAEEYAAEEMAVGAFYESDGANL